MCVRSQQMVFKFDVLESVRKVTSQGKGGQISQSRVLKNRVMMSQF